MPAAARDCAAPKSDIDAAICGDATLKAADEEMATALAAVLPLVGPEQAARLTENQAAWESDNDTQCGKAATLDENRAACLMTRMAARTAYLSASPLSGLGGPERLLPWVYSQPHSETACAGTAETFDFGPAGKTPGTVAFSRAVHDRIAALAASAFARVADNDPEGTCAFAIGGDITYASPALVAVNMRSFFDDDAEHGHYDQVSVVADLAAARILTFDDVFPAAARPKIVAACTAVLRAARLKALTEDSTRTADDAAAEIDAEIAKYYAPVIAARVGDFSHWLVYADHAEVAFPEQSVGPNIEGSYACAFTNAELAAYAGERGWLVK
ncbi:hypothetical protein sos41_05850 [Alphaproteobacteria bacterium SO-S41]|nr:hypothetical protein sos41_05850 [Alphaproteobacteria bacterium SO-S41]